jgi:hypothetical protein
METETVVLMCVGGFVLFLLGFALGRGSTPEKTDFVPGPFKLDGDHRLIVRARVIDDGSSKELVTIFNESTYNHDTQTREYKRKTEKQWMDVAIGWANSAMANPEFQDVEICDAHLVNSPRPIWRNGKWL